MIRRISSGYRVTKEGGEAIVSRGSGTSVTVNQGSTLETAVFTATAAQAGNGIFSIVVPTGFASSGILGTSTATVDGEEVTITASTYTGGTRTLAVTITPASVAVGDRVEITYPRWSTLASNILTVAAPSNNNYVYSPIGLEQGDFLVVTGTGIISVDDSPNTEDQF